MQLILETKGKEHPYKPSDSLIAAQVIKSLPDIASYDQHKIDAEIKRLVHLNYGKFVRQEDHRPYEFRKKDRL